MMEQSTSSSLQIKALTVKVSCNEIWRCPPSKHEEDGDFEWPPGWIEYQNRSNNDTREYHPPSPSRTGAKRKSKVFHSIEEVKKHLKHQEAKKEKDARFTQQSSPTRRSTTRRKSTKQNSSTNNGNIQLQGTIESLNKIMKIDNKLSQNMRQSILISAVLCRKRSETYSQFIGADGLTYPDLRSAFGKHVSMKQCELCKQRVQGPFYCRIAHEHLDVPDYDGGNSYECLRDLFRCSVDDLVERQDEILYGDCDNRKRKATELCPTSEALDDNSQCSMDLMSEEVLLQIALFIPNIKWLISFCKTSKRLQNLLYKSVHSEKLFRGVFLQAFGNRGTIGAFEYNLSWRERWGMIYGIRRGITNQQSPETMLSRNDTRIENLSTIGILSNAEERSALFYDNSFWMFNDDSSNGYFGMKILQLPPPPNASDDWQPPVVCHGDFNGIKIFHSVNSVIADDRNAQSPRYISLGDEEGGGQVLALIQCDTNISMDEQTNSKGPPPCFFIGYASGRVSAVTSKIANCGQKYDFCISGFCDAHENEVTSLAFVVKFDRECRPCGKALHSACGGGDVYCYPYALNPEKNFNMEDSALVFSSNTPIFSMASTIIQSEDGSFFSIICTGDGNGKIKLWTRHYPIIPPNYIDGRMLFTPISVKQAGTRTGLVTRMKFVYDDLLVSGTNNGDLRIWKLHSCVNRRRSAELPPWPTLDLKYDKMGLHNGGIEVVTNVGDILLTSGGNDGKVLGVDLNTGLFLGNLDCHPGEHIQHAESGSMVLAKSCVVDLIISGKDGCMMSFFCRDGTIQQWAFNR